MSTKRFIIIASGKVTCNLGEHAWRLKRLGFYLLLIIYDSLIYQVLIEFRRLLVKLSHLIQLSLQICNLVACTSQGIIHFQERVLIKLRFFAEVSIISQKSVIASRIYLIICHLIVELKINGLIRNKVDWNMTHLSWLKS